MNRKPLRNDVSLAQPLIERNELYSAAGHLGESERLAHLLQFLAGFFRIFDLHSPKRYRGLARREFAAATRSSG